MRVLPTKANLSDSHGSFAELVEACETVGVKVNCRRHRETSRASANMLCRETLASARVCRSNRPRPGWVRRATWETTRRSGSVRYATPTGIRAPRYGVGLSVTSS